MESAWTVWTKRMSVLSRPRGAASLFDQRFDRRRQFENGIGERLVAHGLIDEGSTVGARAGGVSGSDQGATKTLIVLKSGDRERLGRVIRLEAVARKQSRLDIVELVVVFSPVGRAVHPIAPMTGKFA